MSDTPTPRTDAHVESRFKTWDTRTTDAEFSRGLERELAQEREHADRLAAALRLNIELSPAMGEALEAHAALRAEQNGAV